MRSPHLGQSAYPSRERRLSPAMAIILASVCLLLVACGDDGGSAVEEDRSFATDPEPAATTLPATESPVQSATTTPTEQSEIAASPAATPVPQISTRSFVYAIVEGNLVAANLDLGGTEIIATPDDGAVIEQFSASPDGSSVAIVSRRNAESPIYDLIIKSSDGETRSSWNDIAAMLGPPNASVRGQLDLDWAADGSRLAVVFPEGGGIVAHLGGIPEVMLTREQAPAPVDVAWSPDGEAIAFTSRDLDDDSPFLAIGGARILPMDPVRIAGTGGSRPIREIVWLPQGDRLLAVQGSSAQPDSAGGDLIQVDRRTHEASFAVGSSRFGPATQIVQVVPAPDGRNWAIVSIAPGADGGLEASVWSVAADMSSMSRLDLGSDPPVSAVDWTTDGISVTLIDSNSMRVVSFDEFGAPVSSADSVASPVTEPTAVPAASPVSSPIPESTGVLAASPVASPAP